MQRKAERGLERSARALFPLSRRMGTSLAIIDQTYRHLAPDAEERGRELLDAYDIRNDEMEARM